MDAADEKLTALKKAYADIILSISKEAAARVMASERKSVRFQQELKVVKEEGVRLLMRLKHMMDSQISEAEAASLNQQKKIEELEAQLQEAEDIVRDLREELSEMHAELEMVKNENSHYVNEHLDACTEVPMEKKSSSYQSNKHLPPNESSVAFHVKVPYLSHINECHKQYNSIVCTCSPYTGNRYLPSIILRGKDPGLYRNGCTQRIRACDRNLLNSDLCLSEEPDKVKDKKKGGEQKEGRHSSKAPVSGDKSLSDLEKKLLAGINLGTFQSFSWKRKRAVRRRKTLITLGGKRLHLFPKPGQLPEHTLTSDHISVDKSTNCAESASTIVPRLSQDKACPRIAELQTQLGSERASGNGHIMQIYSVMTMHEDGGASDKVVPLREVTAFSEGPSTDCRMDVEIFNEPSHTLESNSSGKTKGLSSQPVRERVIKYTFQRKRKRQALSGSEVKGSHELEKKTVDGLNSDQKLEQPKPSLLKKSSRDLIRCESEVEDSRESEKKTGDGQNGDKKLEQSKPSLLKESSRDSRRLAQVARQLISLSEKKWWH